MPDEMLELLVRVLKKEEGLRLGPYTDSLGWWTIGYGHLIDRRRGGKLPLWIEASFPITQEAAEELLRGDAREAARRFHAAMYTHPVHSPHALARDPVRYVAMAAMTFQLGVSGVMAFKRLLAALERGDWPAAAAEMLDSKWAKEDSPARARRMAAAMASGEVAAFELPKNTAELS